MLCWFNISKLIPSTFYPQYAYTTPFGDYRLKDMTPIVFSWHYGSIVITALFLAVLNGCADSFLHHHLARLGKDISKK